MSGWRRLWITASILLGIPAILLGYEAEKHHIGYVDKYQGDTNGSFWKRAQGMPSLKDCDWGSATSSHMFGNSYRIQCNNPSRYFDAFLWGLLPALLMALIGLTARWIYRGFRPLQK